MILVGYPGRRADHHHRSRRCSANSGRPVCRSARCGTNATKEPTASGPASPKAVPSPCTAKSTSAATICPCRAPARRYVDPHGSIIAVLDASTANSSDSRSDSAPHHGSRSTCRRISYRAGTFLNEFSQSWILRFHSRPEFVGCCTKRWSRWTAAGNILAVNESALLQLGCSTRKALVGEPIERFFQFDFRHARTAGAVSNRARYGRCATWRTAGVSSPLPGRRCGRPRARWSWPRRIRSSRSAQGRATERGTASRR